METSQYELFKTALRNIIKNSNRTQVSKHTETNYLTALKLYLEFVNNGKKRRCRKCGYEEKELKQMKFG